jgi:hypothetical protein
VKSLLKHPLRTRLPFALAVVITSVLNLGAPAQAAGPTGVVQCKLGGKDYKFPDLSVSLQHSAKGIKGPSGNIAHFRLMATKFTADFDESPTSGIDVKTVDVTALGEYKISTAALWRSEARVEDESQKISSGTITFTRFDKTEFEGRASGTLRFETSKTSGSCSFDVPMLVTNLDRLRG